MSKGYFVISLDFELFWGVHDVFSIDRYGSNVKNVRIIIPRLLELFDKYNIHATFGVVGGMYHASVEEFMDNNLDMSLFPKYDNTLLSPYEDHGLSQIKKHPELFFQPLLIDDIRESGQEIATHTYSHYYCNEVGANDKDFSYDINNAINIALKHGDKIESIILPRNQDISDDFKTILIKSGIGCYRCNPYKYFNKQALIFRALRFLSSYFPLTRTCFNLPPNEPLVKIPSSLFLRPYSTIKILNILQLRNIKRSMRIAAKTGKLFHLWWHPHNFGNNMEENFAILEGILKYFNFLRVHFGFESVSMGDMMKIVKRRSLI